MRFLLDECLSARLATLLRDAGHDCVHVQDRELLGASDERVMTCALRQLRVLLSMDTDFGELLARSNARAPAQRRALPPGRAHRRAACRRPPGQPRRPRRRSQRRCHRRDHQ
ncbi:MAG: DUF5615 family PIN-like protein [Sciscionella sp.]|nr:DUF5615 family PIN-like protein [Sciscionella sp.]